MTRAPGLDGFAMPPEWAPHRTTWIAWPHERTDWPGKFAPIPWVYGEIVRVLSRHERVAILVQDAQVAQRARLVLRKSGADLENVEFHRVPTDRSWVRDSGPIFVVNKQGEKIATRWKFNGWAKYPNHKRDGRVAALIAKAARVPEYRVGAGPGDVVMEGGAIDVDGAGNLIATEECLLSDVQARNPNLGREEIEKILWEVLGARRVIWLGRGILGDDTHGHVDDVARFIAPGVVLLCEEKNPRDENYAALEENRERLEGAGMEVVRLPMPSPAVFTDQRLPASYANFYIANEVVIVPTFNDPQDRRALGTIAEFFPEREVVGIHCGDLVWGLGTLHCATQQEPA
jgi:agmatine deiminase